MKKILVINGPSLNLLGIREKEIYGKTSYKELVSLIKNYAKNNNLQVKFYQSNHEGKIIDKIQNLYKSIDGIVINPGAYAHYSYAIYDCIKACNVKTIEVHISDIYNREDFRKELVISKACEKTIFGHGINGYIEALEEFTE